MRLQVIARGWTKAPAIKTAWRPLRKVLNVYMAKVPRPLDSPNWISQRERCIGAELKSVVREQFFPIQDGPDADRV